MDDSSATLLAPEHHDHCSVSGEEERTRVKLPKKLIVCCDGTWMDSDNLRQTPSNVTRITRAITAEDDGHHPQIVYYQAGIGTGLGLTSHLVGGGTGMGLAENIREAYAFLANNYAENDDLCPSDAIFLVGFSRGAYTARSLGGFICAIGVLKKHAMEYFYDIFQDWKNAGDSLYKPKFFDRYFRDHSDVDQIAPPAEWASDRALRDQYLAKYFEYLLALGLTQRAEIKCIGVWDTVGALGVPVNPMIQRVLPFLPSFIRQYSWFDTRLDNSIKNAFQALALDECRFPFSPAVWERQPDCTTNLKQVWFPGAHSNIGGAYKDTGMATITLAWMMDQLAGHTRPKDQEFRNHDWIKFDPSWIDHWYDSEQKYYQQNRMPQYESWSTGKIFDSLTFPESLLGRRVRVPGRYHRTFYESGRVDPEHLLHDTNEYMHACVRVRMECGGRSIEPDWSSVFPKGPNFRPLFVALWRKITRQPPPTFAPQDSGRPMYGWTLCDGHEYHDSPNTNIDMNSNGHSEIRWKYTGRGRCLDTVMLEDRLGFYERQLLSKDSAIAEQVEYTNSGGRMLPNMPFLGKRSAKTF